MANTEILYCLYVDGKLNGATLSFADFQQKEQELEKTFSVSRVERKGYAKCGLSEWWNVEGELK